MVAAIMRKVISVLAPHVLDRYRHKCMNVCTSVVGATN